jgi:AraC family transcriptional regulator of arabinose operon
MEYSAMGRVETMHPEVNRVLCGRLSEGSEYSTWRVRGTTDFLLIQTLSGSGRVGGADGELITGVGDAVLLPPNVPHDYGTAIGASHWDLAFAHFRPRTDWMPLLEWPQRHGSIGFISTSGEIHSRVARALHKGTRMQADPFERSELFAVNALEEALLWLDSQNPLRTRLDERVLSVVEYVRDHIAEQLSAQRLAAVAHLSPSRLSRLFTLQLGVTPQQYVERERMLLAQQLLGLTNRPVGEIARQLGWDDPFYFSKRFHRFSGLSPSDYRATGRGL